jgi:hypothetical protein
MTLMLVFWELLPRASSSQADFNEIEIGSLQAIEGGLQSCKQPKKWLYFLRSYC